jgi:hypothetical protein
VAASTAPRRSLFRHANYRKLWTAAMNGIAIWLTCVPNSETVAAVQSFR